MSGRQDKEKEMDEKRKEIAERIIDDMATDGASQGDINQQKMVFWTVNGNSVGVRLTEGNLMIPRKSISGIIGIGYPEVENYNPCKTCDRYDCRGRR